MTTLIAIAVAAVFLAAMSLFLYAVFTAPLAPASHEEEDDIQHGPDGTTGNGTNSPKN